MTVNFNRKIICVILLCAVLASGVLAGCGKSKTAQEAEFPLSAEALTAVLKESGLDWTITETDDTPVGTQPKIVHSLKRPDSGVDFNTVFVNTYISDDIGRGLQLIFVEPQSNTDKALPESWEECRDMLVLGARVYGGFDDPEEIYKACAATELPTAVGKLWEGALSGGYCVLSVSSNDSAGKYTLSLTVYESEEACSQYRAINAASVKAYEAAKAEGAEAVEAHQKAMTGDKATRDAYLAPFMEQ